METENYETTQKTLEQLGEAPDILKESTAFDTIKAESEEQNRNERKKYAARIFSLIISWLTIVLSIVTIQGFYGVFGFHLDYKVIITLITTTTGSVIGILIIVVRYLFAHPDNDATKIKNRRKKKREKER